MRGMRQVGWRRVHFEDGGVEREAGFFWSGVVVGSGRKVYRVCILRVLGMGIKMESLCSRILAGPHYPNMIAAFL